MCKVVKQSKPFLADEVAGSSVTRARFGLVVAHALLRLSSTQITIPQSGAIESSGLSRHGDPDLARNYSAVKTSISNLRDIAADSRIAYCAGGMNAALKRR